MKKSAPVPTIIPGGESNGLIFKILGIFALVFIIIIIIYYVTSRKTIENFEDKNLSCSVSDFDSLGKQIESQKCESLEKLLTKKRELSKELHKLNQCSRLQKLYQKCENK